jgi:hypothetical protein
MPTAAPNRPRRLAVLEQIPTGWRLLVSRGAAGSIGQASAASVEMTADFDARDASGLAGALRKSKADRLLRLIPAGAGVCRSVTSPAPGGSDVEIASALSLVAEAHLGDGMPAHRRSAGDLGVGGVAAVGWAGNGVEAPPLSSSELAGLTWCPHLAALGALASASGAALGLAADRETGVIVVVGSNAGQHVARVTREDGSDPLEWQAAVDAAIASASHALRLSNIPALDAGQPRAIGLFAADGRRVLPDRVSGVDASPAWLGRFGLSLGAALLAADPTPASAPLLAMTPEPFVPPRPAVLRLVDWLAKPSRAVAAFILCGIVILGWPLAAAATRHARLLAVASADRADDSEERAARQQAEFYDLLRARRWPMAKLLADLTAAAPPGITLESLTLEAGQRVRIAGVAESSQAVSDWRSALMAGRIFDDIRVPNNEASGASVKFEISARVAQPLTLASGKSIAATPVTITSPAAPVQAEPAPAERTGSSGAATGGRATRRGATPAKPEVPGPISDEEIASLDRAAAMREFASRRKAASTAGLDEETKARLTSEADKAKARMDQLRAGGDAAPQDAPPPAAPSPTAPVGQPSASPTPATSQPVAPTNGGGQ